jgi:DNA-binding response OmpR family regulator
MTRILIINDDFRTVAVKEALAGAGYEVSTDWSQATRLGEAQHVSLVIVPVFLPGKDRLQILQEVRKHFSAVPILALIARVPTEQDARLLKQLGATRVLEHSAQATTLLGVVAATLRQNIS